MKKQAISIRLDPKVLSWFRKSYPDGYQKAINEILDEHVLRHERQSYFIAGQAQRLFDEFYTQCFWHLRRDLEITPERIELVKEGLRRHGGKRGYLLAAELEKKS
jgi:hypothetical protein